MADDEIGGSESGSSPLGPEGPRPGAEGEDRGRPGSAAGGRPGAGRLDVIGFRLEPDRIMMAVRLGRASPTCSLVVGPGAQARMCRRREKSFGLVHSTGLHDREEFDWP
jgi:hypothetical protein